MSQRPSVYNILILQGSDWNDTTIQLRNGVRVNGVAPYGQRYLSIDPLGFELLTGDTLKYDKRAVITLSDPAPVGSETLQIEPLSTVVFANSDLIGLPLDLTGYTARFQIRKQYSDLAPLFSGVAEISNPTQGLISPSIAHSITTEFPPNCNWETLPNNLQDKEAFQLDTKLKKVWNASYRWDLEVVSPLGMVSRRVEGRVFVSAEVTR